MGLRETLNTNKTAGYVVGGIVLLLGLGAVGYEYGQSRGGAASGTAFYTVDDGATLFTDESTKMPPFDHDGKPAVRAYVYKSGDQQFVAYLERYSPEALKVFQAVERVKAGDTSTPPPDSRALEAAGRYGRQVKKPGEKAWVAIGTPLGSKLTREIAPPPGAAGKPVEAVTP